MRIEKRRAPVDYKGPARPSAASLGDLLYVAPTRESNVPRLGLSGIVFATRNDANDSFGVRLVAQLDQEKKRVSENECTWPGMISASAESIARLYTSELLCFFSFCFGSLEISLECCS